MCGASPRADAHPLSQQLHWLPVASRIPYKLCELMFDIYHGTVPSYVLELCKRCTDSDRLRSAAHGDVTIPRTRLRFTDRSFTVAGPKAWNALPSRLRTLTCKDTFRKHLKTHFLSIFFNSLLTILFYVFYRAIVVRHHWASLSGALEIFTDWLIDWLIDWVTRCDVCDVSLSDIERQVMNLFMCFMQFLWDIDCIVWKLWSVYFLYE